MQAALRSHGAGSNISTGTCRLGWTWIYDPSTVEDHTDDSRCAHTHTHIDTHKIIQMRSNEIKDNNKDLKPEIEREMEGDNQQVQLVVYRLLSKAE